MNRKGNYLRRFSRFLTFSTGFTTASENPEFFSVVQQPETSVNLFDWTLETRNRNQKISSKWRVIHKPVLRFVFLWNYVKNFDMWLEWKKLKWGKIPQWWLIYKSTNSYKDRRMILSCQVRYGFKKSLQKLFKKTTF